MAHLKRREHRLSHAQLDLSRAKNSLTRAEKSNGN